MRSTTLFAFATLTIASLGACSSSASSPTSALPVSAPPGTSAASAAPVGTPQATPTAATGAITPVSSAGSVVAPTSPAPIAETVPAGGVNPNAPEVHEVGDIPDNQLFVPYVPASGLYTISYPEGWSRTGDGDNVSFTDKLNAIEVAVIDKAAQPSVDTVKADDLVTLAAKTSNFAIGKVSAISRKGGDAILATYEIDSAPNSVTGKVIRVAVERYEFWKSGKSVVVTLIGAVGADNVDPWKIVSDSFGWTK